MSATKILYRISYILRIIGSISLYIYIFIELPLRVYDTYIATISYPHADAPISAAKTNRHPILEYTASPNIDGTITFIEPEKKYTVKTNSLGFRTHEIYPKQEGEYRIVLLGDSFTFGWNANQNETYAVKLEEYLQKNISKNIRVYSLGIAGYSPLKYVLLLRLYAQSIQPDMIIVSVDQSDFNEDLTSIERYEFDQNGIPIRPKDGSITLATPDTPVRAVDIHGNLISENVQFNSVPITQGFSTIKYAEKLYSLLRRIYYEQKIPIIENTYELQPSHIVSYTQLVQTYGTNLIDHLPDRLVSDFIPYELHTALDIYKPTIRFLQYIKDIAELLHSDVIFSVYPYPWMVSTHESLPYQDSVFNSTVYDMRTNRVHPQLVESISQKVGADFINAYPFFESLSPGYYGKYDPHFSAKGYERYAIFLYGATKDRIKNTMQKKE